MMNRNHKQRTTWTVWGVSTILTALFLLASCGSQDPELLLTNTPQEVVRDANAQISPTPIGQNEIKQETEPIKPQPSEETPSRDAPSYGYTYQRADGNRLLSGWGSFPDVDVVDVPLEGMPIWLAAAPGTNTSIWVAILEDGCAQAFSISGQAYTSVRISPNSLPAGSPPLLEVNSAGAYLVVAPSEDASHLTTPAILDGERGRLAYIASNGDLVIWEQGVRTRLPVNALLDGRLLVDERQRLLLLSDPTERYDHGVLGDKQEAASITLVETTPTPRIVMEINIDPPGVIEGIAPIWADLTGDGQREIIVTRSDAEIGAQILVYDERGNLIAKGPEIGRGYRWRNQLSVAPFSPSGKLELTDVLTPHIGGLVEFYRFVGDRLEIIAQVGGYTSHVIGTRNLDMALSGDFKGDSIIEVVLPAQDLTKLKALQRIEESAAEIWSLEVGGNVSTNLSAVVQPGGGLALGVGRHDGTMRVWISK